MTRAAEVLGALGKKIRAFLWPPSAWMSHIENHFCPLPRPSLSSSHTSCYPAHPCLRAFAQAVRSWENPARMELTFQVGKWTEKT